MRRYGAVGISPLNWQKASLCQTGECVEIASYNGMVVMRNSSRPQEGQAYFTAKEFSLFVQSAKAGEFNFPG